MIDQPDAPGRDARRARVARHRVPAPLRQVVRRRRGRGAHAASSTTSRGRRRRRPRLSQGVAFFNSFRDLTARRLLEHQDGRRGSAVPGQRGESRVERLPAGSAQEARRAAVDGRASGSQRRGFSPGGSATARSEDDRMSEMTRREALAAAGAVAAGSVLAGTEAAAQPSAVKNGRLKQSVCRWCYSQDPARRSSARAVKDIGLTAIDLLQPDEWRGRASATGSPARWASRAGGGSIPDGLNNRRSTTRSSGRFETVLPKAKKMGVPNLITFFGNRKGMADGEAIDNCVNVLGRLRPLAETARRHDLHRAAQQQGRSQGLPVRPHRVGRGGGEGRRLGADQAALRHLPHADHGRRRDPHHPAEQAVHRPLPHRRRPRPPRDRRHAGAALAGDRQGDRSTPATPATSPTSSSRRATR